MENFNLYTPTEIIFGRDAEQQTGCLLTANGCRNVLVLYGGESAKQSGLLARIEKKLSDSAISFSTLGGVHPNPLDNKVYEGIELCRTQNIDFILAVGGGSVIDTAKAIAIGVSYEGDFWDFYEGKAKAQSALPIGVVLTIPAAGSEGSGNSVITRANGKLKLGIRYHKLLRPRFAVMNPELTYTLPPFQTACGITDMIVHILERYFSNTDGVDLTDRICEGALISIMSQAKIVMSDPNNCDARANIMFAGTIAHNGLCGVGREEDWATHYMEHELSALYDVAHGAGLATMLPAWMTYVSALNPHKIAQFAYRVLGIAEQCSDEQAALMAAQAMERFFETLNLPTSFAQLGAKAEDIDLLVKKLHINKGPIVGAYCKIDSTASHKIFELAAK